MDQRDPSHPNPNPAPAADAPRQRSYRKPRLTRLGTLTEVTQLTGTMGNVVDGHNNNKTT